MSAFQNGKDTFYVTLRDRLAALNPDRTAVVRGATRPAVVVEENELATFAELDLIDAFALRWTESAVDRSEAMVLERGRCEITFVTAGSAEVAGMDRGRTLGAMGEELRLILQPYSSAQQSFGTGAAVPLQTGVFWSEPVFAPVTVKADRVSRVATVEVFAWKEAA